MRALLTLLFLVLSLGSAAQVTETTASARCTIVRPVELKKQGDSVLVIGLAKFTMVSVRDTVTVTDTNGRKYRVGLRAKVLNLE